VDDEEWTIKSGRSRVDDEEWTGVHQWAAVDFRLVRGLELTTDHENCTEVDLCGPRTRVNCETE